MRPWWSDDGLLSAYLENVFLTFCDQLLLAVERRFGFANPEALANGETGTACRGEEHDVTIVWSITSGKRLVLCDGQEVHYSNNRSNILDFSWTMRGNHVLKVIAHASPPLSATPGFRQYDFLVDGQTFFSFPKVYRLGMAPNDPRAVASPRSPPSMADRGRPAGYNPNASTRSAGSANIANLEAPHNADEEEAYLQEAIKNSLQENKKDVSGGASVQSAPAGGVGDNLLLDFFTTPGPQPLALPYVFLFVISTPSFYFAAFLTIFFISCHQSPCT